MKLLYELIGNGPFLTWYQMGTRAFLIFLIALVYIRFAGRRAFGMGSSFDNVLTILLGAVLARGITAAPFFPSLFAALVIILLYRLFAFFSLKNDKIGKIIKGNAVVIFDGGQLIHENMSKCMVTRRDLLESMRKSGIENFDDLKIATVERSGQISIVRKS